MNLEDFKKQYQKIQSSIQQDFLKDPDSVEALVLRRSDAIDALLSDIWHSFKMGDELCLVAVGGYGRSEPHPYSAKQLYFFNLILYLFLLILITLCTVFVSIDRICFYF
ncbi:MAG: hypothetical protein HON30_03450 [Nitrosopumilus sp.]|nr:hypothetical protein [Nitrosopumilus sp.]